MVSIIIPVYNAEKTIAKCIKSILHNNYDDYEVILIDDGSVDDSWKIMTDYATKYPDKIKIFNQENQGVAKTRNRGINYANFKYILFVDCDDYIEHDYIKRFVDEITAEDLDMVIGGYRRTTATKTLFKMKLQNVEWSKYMIMAPWAKIYRRDFLLENKIEFLDNNIGEDVYFNLQAISLTDKISIIGYCGYNWFYNEQSVSNSKQKNIKNKMNVMFLLDSSYNKLEKIGVINRKEVEFYFIRYIVWYLLFIGQKARYGEISTEFIKIFDWLKERFPQFYKNKNISLFLPQGETFKNRIAVYVFIWMYRLNLIKIFFRAYANRSSE